MNEAIRALEPSTIWNHFADLNAVPRASKKEERVIEFMKDFGQQLGLETMVDAVGNVIIRKPATPGMEDRTPIVMQSHLDMVHQKNADTNFDFDTQGIEMYVDGDWVRAKGTTLGADNGLGVATIMAILASDDIPHPALEGLFTIDEETGMTGAMGLEGGILQGQILLNLDTEEDDEIGVGCAGGVDVTASGMYTQQPTKEGQVAYNISVKGLQGGHSGMDIHKGFGNANKLMNRLLNRVSAQARISSIDGGGLRNAIPRESTALVVVEAKDVSRFVSGVESEQQYIIDEYHLIEPDLQIEVSKTHLPTTVMAAADQQALIRAVYAAHNGVFRMSPAIEDLVETSNNLARVGVSEGSIEILCLTRSSVESSKNDMANSLRAVFELAGYSVALSGSYPGWAPNMDSPILKVLDQRYQARNGQRAHIAACHAGLECGILGTNYPGMDMISFGPTIKGAHSPDERASISSTQKYWDFVLDILQHIPKQV